MVYGNNGILELIKKLRFCASTQFVLEFKLLAHAIVNRYPDLYIHFLDIFFFLFQESSPERML